MQLIYRKGTLELNPYDIDYLDYKILKQTWDAYIARKPLNYIVTINPKKGVRSNEIIIACGDFKMMFGLYEAVIQALFNNSPTFNVLDWIESYNQSI